LRRLAGIALIVSIVCALAGPACADALVEKTRSQLSRVKDYTCDLTLNARLPQMSVSSMKMTLYYKRPNKIHIEAKEGFAMLPEEGLYIGDPVEEVLSKYTLVHLGDIVWQGKKCAKYGLRAKSDAVPPLANASVYIDRVTATPAGFTGASPNFGEITTVFTYQKLQGRFWLPAATTLSIRNMMSVRHDRSTQPGSGSAQITYTNYKINSGLPDSLFKTPAKPVSKMRKHPHP